MESRSHIIAYAYHNGFHLYLRQGSALDVQGADCLVNAANERLSHGGGVALEIAQQAGNQLNDQSKLWVSQYGEILPGSTAITPPFNLASKNFKCIVHAVGPKNEDERGCNMLVSTLVNSMKDAELSQCKVLSIPALSVGIFGFPKESSALRHYEAFVIFSGYGARIQFLRTIVINLFTDEEADIFACKFLEFSDNFQCSQFFGTIKQQGQSPFMFYCKTCQSNYQAEFFGLTGCCFSICDFCISKQKSKMCFGCNKGLESDRAELWRCIKCKGVFSRSNGFICPQDGNVYEYKFNRRF